MSRIVRIVAFGLGLFGALVASQGPEFSQQYRQRLGGGIDELRRVIARFEAAARAGGETRESAIARLRSNPDALASSQGSAMQAHVERLTRLEAHRRAMAEAGPFARIALMAREGDREIVTAAYREFEPAVPVTVEGAASAALGFAAAWGGMLMLAALARSLWRRRKAPARARRDVQPARSGLPDSTT